MSRAVYSSATFPFLLFLSHPPHSCFLPYYTPTCLFHPPSLPPSLPLPPPCSTPHLSPPPSSCYPSLPFSCLLSSPLSLRNDLTALEVAAANPNKEWDPDRLWDSDKLAVATLMFTVFMILMKWLTKQEQNLFKFIVPLYVLHDQSAPVLMHVHVHVHNHTVR